jgi:hypothetical protein
MNYKLLAASALLLASTFAYADAKEDVVAATKNLAGESYTWKSSTEGGFGGTQEGKRQKDGLVWVSVSFRDNTIEVVKKGEQGAVKTDGGWKPLADVVNAGEQGPARFIARLVQNSKGPAVEAQEIAEKLEKVEKSGGGAYAAKLSEEQVKSILTSFRPGANQLVQVKSPKGEAKFWLKDGAMAKVQYQLSGIMTFNDQERDVSRTTTVEFKDVGNTRVELPAEAKEAGKLK